ncbi:MAG: Stf0 sulfotransferase family protein [Phototrophicaceae bacterium]
MEYAQTSYAILASNRSGSSLLCNLLAQTTVAGLPNEFLGDWEGSLYRDYNMSDFRQYLQRIINEFTTENGIFGVKAMGADLLQYCERLETFPEYSGSTHAEKVRAFFPNMKFIYLTRRHKVEQAISWWKAAQNNHYHTTATASVPDIELKYDFDAVTQLLNEVIMQESAHQDFLNKIDIVPLTIVYEDYIQDMQGTVQTIIEYLEIEDEYNFQDPQLYKMADDTTKEWAERYRQELQEGWTNIRW